MGRRKYTINNDFFGQLDQNSAYILGLLSADGNVARDNIRITLSICDRDAEILEKINKCMKSSYPIKEYIVKEKYKQKILRFSSKEICQTLFLYGITPNKSLKLKFPNIPETLVSHYIRGYFDGDGCVNVTKMNNICITTLGTEFFLTELKKKYNDRFNNNRGWIVRHNKSNIFRFCLGGNISARLFLEWIYGDSDKSLRFKRKYEIYQNFINPV